MYDKHNIKNNTLITMRKLLMGLTYNENEEIDNDQAKKKVLKLLDGSPLLIKNGKENFWFRAPYINIQKAAILFQRQQKLLPKKLD